MKVLTFDIEEWFHILDIDSTSTEQEWSRYESRIHRNTDRIIELLYEKDQKATFFCLGWIAKKYPEIIKKIDSQGHEIASHSDMHQLIFQKSKSDFAHDLDRSIKRLQDLTGKRIRAFRSPGFSLREDTKWVFEILIEYGIEIDCSVFPAKRGHGGFETFGSSLPCLIEVNGLTIKEFPVNPYKIMRKPVVFSGGGYFRLFPYWVIRNMFKKTDYVMTYFHPRDFDNLQPRIKELSLLRKFKSYYGLKAAYKKFDNLLTDFDFIDIKTADEQIDWTVAERVKI